jgi:hypothetical protein
MSHWNYRVVRTRDIDSRGSIRYGIHEVFYGDDLDLVTVETMAPEAYDEGFEEDFDPIEELRQTLEWMLLALDKPILDYHDDFEGSDE